jgi:hypothetical protein
MKLTYIFCMFCFFSLVAQKRIMSRDSLKIIELDFKKEELSFIISGDSLFVEENYRMKFSKTSIRRDNVPLDELIILVNNTIVSVEVFQKLFNEISIVEDIRILDSICFFELSFTIPKKKFKKLNQKYALIN